MTCRCARSAVKADRLYNVAICNFMPLSINLHIQLKRKLWHGCSNPLEHRWKACCADPIVGVPFHSRVLHELLDRLAALREGERSREEMRRK